jgi:hypothetical protein
VVIGFIRQTYRHKDLVYGKVRSWVLATTIDHTLAQARSLVDIAVPDDIFNPNFRKLMAEFLN